MVFSFLTKTLYSFFQNQKILLIMPVISSCRSLYATYIFAFDPWIRIPIDPKSQNSNWCSCFYLFKIIFFCEISGPNSSINSALYMWKAVIGLKLQICNFHCKHDRLNILQCSVSKGSLCLQNRFSTKLPAGYLPSRSQDNNLLFIETYKKVKATVFSNPNWHFDYPKRPNSSLGVSFSGHS